MSRTPPSFSPPAWAPIMLYHQSHRHYHNLGHIFEMYSTAKTLGWILDLQQEVAIWFHDAVYEPGSSDNEAMSAGWAANAIQEWPELSDISIDEVEQCIYATNEHRWPGGPTWAHRVLDLDLAILGASKERYAAYVRGIRLEYIKFSQAQWVSGRLSFLDKKVSLAKAGNLFNTLEAKRVFEDKALYNMLDERFELMEANDAERDIE